MSVQDKIKILENYKDHINFSYDGGYYIDDEIYENQIANIDKQINELLDTQKDTSINEKQIYSYKGPIYKYGKYIGESEYIETTAPSINKAKSNITFRIKNKLQLQPYSDIKIDVKRIKLVN